MYTNSYELILGSNICYLRKKHGLSKKAMAKLLGIGVKSLSLLERGTIPQRMSVDVLFRIFTAFHIKPHTLLTVPLDPLSPP